jgi:hypothetical protein
MGFLKMSDERYWMSPGRFAQLDRIIPTVRHTYFVLGDADGEKGQAALIMQMQPGHVVNSHAHSSTVFEVIIQGSIEVGGEIYQPGDVMVLEPGESCGKATAGADGCTTVEFFGSVQGAHKLIYRDREGAPIEWDVLEQRRRPASGEIDPAGTSAGAS